MHQHCCMIVALLSTGQSIISGPPYQTPRTNNSNSSGGSSYAAAGFTPPSNQPSMRVPTPLASSPALFAQQLTPSLSAGPSLQSTPIGGYAALPVAFNSSSSAGPAAGMDWQWLAGSNSNSSAGMYSPWDASTNSAAGPYGSRYSPQMQQLMAQQQQQQQQRQPGSSNSGRCGSTNGAGGYYGYDNSCSTMDMGFSNGGYQGLYAYATPRAVSAADTSAPGAAVWEPNAMLPASTHGGTNDGLGPASDWYTTGKQLRRSGSLAQAAQPAAVQPAGSGHHTPVRAAAMPQFTVSKGAFCGKVIVQPPGEPEYAAVALYAHMYCIVLHAVQCMIGMHCTAAPLSDPLGCVQHIFYAIVGLILVIGYECMLCLSLFALCGAIMSRAADACCHA